uniref:Uncharacterized protein n=1 Tax=Tetranychus urticae TaxID=32264 RepID=T1KYU6_TETUR
MVQYGFVGNIDEHLHFETFDEFINGLRCLFHHPGCADQIIIRERGQEIFLRSVQEIKQWLDATDAEAYTVQVDRPRRAFIISSREEALSNGY